MLMQAIHRVSWSWCLAAAAGLLLLQGGVDASAGVIYEYVDAGTGAVIGTLEVDTPPASATSGWTAVDESSLLALFLDDALFGLGAGNLVTGSFVGFTATSLTG